MSSETLARWQFGITTVYHFLFVPITLALVYLVAILQTFWVRTGNLNYLRLTKFYGKLFLINFAMGVVTGIVQEFQFGMNWSDYSRFVGDIFGAPLALEALLAFFMESTFLGLWIFGWDRLPKKLHLATIWIAAVGTTLSAIFILAANSFMQNPVGFRFNEVTNRAELTDFGAVLTNPVFLATFPHQMTAAWLVSGALMAAVAGWHLDRLSKQGEAAKADEVKSFRFAAKMGAIALLIGGLGVVATGDIQGKVMYQAQPMKMAAAEAAWEDGNHFSVITIGTMDGKHEVWSLKVPGLLSFLAHGNFTEEVPGIKTIQARYEKGEYWTKEYKSQDTLKIAEVYSPDVAQKLNQNYAPDIPVSYWTFRIMITLGMISMAIGAYMLFAMRKGRLPQGKLWRILMIALPLAPLFANSFGWIFTEMGRQPWIVFGMMPTAAGVSPGVSPGMVLFSMVLFTVVYAVLAVIEVGLLLKYIKAGLPDVTPPEVLEDEDAPLSFAY